MLDEPPLLKQLAGGVIIIAIVSTYLLLPVKETGVALSQPAVAFHQRDEAKMTTKMIISRGSVYGLASPTSERTLASRGGLTDIPELNRIIWAESSNRWWVKNPNSSAYGYCQMLEGTRDYVEQKWGMTIDWNNPEAQLYACERLYREEGIRHWEASRAKWELN